MKRLFWGVAVVTLAFLLVVTACTSPTSTPQPTQAPVATATKPPTPTQASATSTPVPPTATAAQMPAATPITKTLQIGFIGPLSGAAATYGLTTLRGAEMAASDVNAAGGLIIGGTRYNLKVNAVDDKYTGAAAVSAANKLIYEEKVDMIFTVVGVTVTAVQPITEAEKLLHLSTNGIKEFLGPTKPYSFRVIMGAAEYYPVLYSWLKQNHPEIKTVGYLSTNNDFGQSLNEMSLAVTEPLGFKRVATEYFETTATDYYPVLTKVLAAKPDIVDWSAFAPAMAGAMAKQLWELGFTGWKITPSAASSPVLVNVAGKDAVDLLLNADMDYNSALATAKEKEFYKRYVDKYNEWVENALFGYNGTMAYVQAAKLAGSIDSSKVKEALESPGFTFEHTAGTGRFGGTATYGIGHHQVLYPGAVTITAKGEIKVMSRQTPAIE